jgi:D-alanyl-D-alanine carboxypeptidase (penicillin-binding protein 5/6)
MTNTNFANANGLPDSRNISTARDLAILSRAVMRDYPQYYRLFSTKSFNFRGQTIGNHNHMLSEVSGVDGLKTGFTNASGFNIAVSGVRDNRRLIVVVLGGPNRITRDRVAESLLNTGFEVLDRRARGEQITVAQNFFEPPQLAEATQASMQQGDTESGLRVQLASAPPPSRASKIQIVEPSSVAKLNGKGKKEAGGRWTIQVGAFKNRADAREQLDIVGKKFGRHVDDARAVAEKDAGRFVARFSGMTEADAKNACKAIKSRKQPCVVISPGRG